MEDIEPTPTPPGLGHIIAVILELSIVATFIVHRSAVGLLLCVAYAYFSATRALFAKE
jgi:hypothetical protein